MRPASGFGWARLATMWLIVVSETSCGAQSEEVLTVQARDVPKGELASVGGFTFPAVLLPEGKPAREGLQALIADGRLAEQSRSASPHRAQAIERGVLARALVETLARTSLKRMPPSPEELAAVKEERWEELDRPRAVRSGYAYLPFGELSAGDAEFALMERVAEAVSDLADLNQFAPTVEKLQTQTLEVRVAELPPLTADGRVVTRGIPQGGVAVPPQPYSESIAKLTEKGETTPVVPTSVGLFVGIALDFVPPDRATPEEAELIVRRGVEAVRVKPQLSALQQEADRSGRVKVSPRHRALTRLVWRED